MPRTTSQKSADLVAKAAAILFCALMSWLMVTALIGARDVESASIQSTDVVIFPSQTFQTIEGWGNGAGELIGQQFQLNYYQLGKAIADPVNYQLIDFVADDLGMTGSRLTEVGTRSDQKGTDHGDSDSIDRNLFEPGTL